MGFSKWYFWVVKQNGAFKKGQNAFRETELSTSQLLFPEKFFGEMIERLNIQIVCPKDTWRSPGSNTKNL